MNAQFDASAAAGSGSTQEGTGHQVAVIGLGYVGLPMAAMLASYDWDVCGVDTSELVVETINSGRVHIEERGLDSLVHEATKSKRLVASLEVPRADFYVIAVPTPLSDEKTPVLDYVEAAVRAICPKLEPGACVIIESTSPVSTTERIAEIIAELRPDLTVPKFGEQKAGDIALAYCPERVLPGNIVCELVENDRVIGGMTPGCANRAKELYASFVEGECLITSARVAEMVKLVENSFRDVNIAFANELSVLADEFGVDVWDVIGLANRHPRVNILQPGPGVGGHCIAVDPWFLVSGAPNAARLIRTAREVNDFKASYTEQRIRALLQAVPGGTIALLGLAFKPNVDDFRESPALEIARNLAHTNGKQISIVEPYAAALPISFDGSGARLADLDEGLANADIVVILVDHDVFKCLTQESLAGKLVYDTRGMLK